MSKISVMAKLTAQEGKRDELIDAFADYHPQVESEPGTLVYAVHADAGEDDVVWIYELYEDQDALSAHSGSEAFASFGSRLGDLLAGAPELIMARPAHAKGLAL